MKEILKDFLEGKYKKIPVSGNDYYFVSELGVVLKVTKDYLRVVTTHVDYQGYVRCTIILNGDKRVAMIHRLVAITFHENPDNKPEVNHKDGIKTHNCPENLEWCTAKENSRHALATGLRDHSKYNFAKGERGWNSKLTAKDVEYIRGIGKSAPYIEIAKKFNIAVSTVGGIVRGESWKHLL